MVSCFPEELYFNPGDPKGVLAMVHAWHISTFIQ